MKKSQLKVYLAICCMAGMAMSANGQKNVTQNGVTYSISRVGVGANELAARIHTVSVDVSATLTVPERLDTLMKFSGGEVHPLVVGMEKGAFQGNGTIKTLTLPASLTEFPDSAFKDCKALTSISMPGMSGTVPAECFYNCTSLSEVTLPDGVQAIGFGAFWNCTSLKNIVFPETLDSIANMAFARVPFKNLTFPSGVTFIGPGAFSYNAELKSVEFPDSMRYLAGFNHCTSLSSVNLPQKLGVVGAYAFGETPITSISFPDNLCYILVHAFRGCKGLTEVAIPESVFYLAGFDNCINLSKINLPKNLMLIATAAFENCTLLDRERLEIPDGVYRIYPYAFAGWTKLREVVLPEKTNTVAGFNGCTNLRSINLDNVGSLWIDAFRGCVNLFGETLELPESIKYMMPGCLADMPHVKSVKLPEGLKMIGGFEGCTGLTEISIPTGNEIGIVEKAFKGCTSLTEITIPANVWGVGPDVFKGCISLRSVVLEDTKEMLQGIVRYVDEYDSDYMPAPGTLLSDAPVEFLHIGRPFFEGRIVDKATGEEFDVKPLEGLTTLKTLELGPTVQKLPSLDGPANKNLQVIRSQPLTPPMVNAFSEEQYANVTLWIPYADFATSPYAADPVWSKFGRVEFDAALDEVGADAGVPVATRYYNLQGMEVTTPTEGEVYVVKTLLSTGTTTVTKQVYYDAAQ